MPRKKKRSRSPPPKVNLNTVTILVAIGKLALFILIAMGPQSSEVSTESDQQMLMSRLTEGDTVHNIAPILNGGAIDQQELNDLAEKDYDELKDYLGIQSDFVVYFEDSNGQIVNIIDRPCLGSTFGQVNGQQCR